MLYQVYGKGAKWGVGMSQLSLYPSRCLLIIKSISCTVITPITDMTRDKCTQKKG